MKRRTFIAGLGGAAVWPFRVRAEGAIPVIGFLNSGSPGPATAQVEAFQLGLKENGYLVGQNVSLDFRWAEQDSWSKPRLGPATSKRSDMGRTGKNGASALGANRTRRDGENDVNDPERT